MSKIDIEIIQNHLIKLQNKICCELESVDTSKKFNIDKWQHNHITGNTAVLRDGNIFEHAGIGFSYLKGDKLPASATTRNPDLLGCSFEATGVSLIIHPKNPYIPTTHANIRFFVATKENQKPIWWFGGGFDLTPYYPFVEDCKHWHTVANDLCKPYGDDIYPKFKKWCDEYFYLPHRKEARGIGGLFFDDLNDWPFEDCFNFFKAVGNGFLDGYLPIVNKRKNTKFSQRERDFQLYRRGRYVEFNLLYDRGTLFGLQSGGRAESILMSLPPNVSWHYDWQPETDSPEQELSEYLEPKEWLMA